jgi:hypothetical protein
MHKTYKVIYWGNHEILNVKFEIDELVYSLLARLNVLPIGTIESTYIIGVYEYNPKCQVNKMVFSEKEHHEYYCIETLRELWSELYEIGFNEGLTCIK